MQIAFSHNTLHFNFKRLLETKDGNKSRSRFRPVRRYSNCALLRSEART